MAMSPIFYQLSGFKGQIRSNSYDDKELATAIAGPSSPLLEHGRIELTLGLKRCGSSHLLLRQDQMVKLYSTIRHPEGRPFNPIHFESLSPIYFYSSDQLVKKLASLKPGKKSDNRDTSQANKAYSNDGDIPYRGVYEHGRVVYSLLNNLINPALYGVHNITSLQSELRVAAFIFNTKSVDDRKFEEKIRHPIVLDIGICDGSIPSLEPNFSTAKHLINGRYLALGGGKDRLRKPFQYGTSKVFTEAELSTEIKTFFRNHQSLTPNPMILLVFDDEISKNYLRNLGVNIEKWCDGLRELLLNESIPPAHRNEASSSRQGHKRDPRARSPRRPDPSDFQLNRRRSPDERPTPKSSLYPPVFVIDIKQLYSKLLDTDTHHIRHIVDVARALKLPVQDGMCAGHEVALALNIWKYMTSNSPIDEQRQNLQFQTHGPDVSETVSQQIDEDEDEEQDPNDIPEAPQAKNQAQYGNILEDGSDYGGSDSEDDD